MEQDSINCSFTGLDSVKASSPKCLGPQGPLPYQENLLPPLCVLLILLLASAPIRRQQIARDPGEHLEDRNTMPRMGEALELVQVTGSKMKVS